MGRVGRGRGHRRRDAGGPPVRGPDARHAGQPDPDPVAVVPAGLQVALAQRVTVTSPTSAAAAPACRGSQLPASIGPHGPAAGTENILTLLHNTSDRTCTLGGPPTLTGVRADGSTSPLGFRRTSNQAYIALTTTGPGPLPPGGRGGINVTEGLNNCTKLGTFAYLRIALPGNQHVDMPWPGALSLELPDLPGPGWTAAIRDTAALTPRSGAYAVSARPNCGPAPPAPGAAVRARCRRR